MPHISQMFQSKWITVEDVRTPVVATIRACTPETFRARSPGGAPDTRWILWFHEAQKGLRLNSTNIKILAQGFGETTEQWIGQRVRLYVDPNVQFGGQTVGGVRIQCPRSAHPAAFTQPQGAFAGQPAQPVNNGAFGQPPVSTPGAFGTNVDPTTGEIYGKAGNAGRHAATAPGGTDPDFDDDIPF